jgi:hypothetical protein
MIFFCGTFTTFCFGYTIPFKKDEPLQKKIGGFGIVNYYKPSFNAICGKCAVGKIRNAFMSNIVVSIHKVVFSRSFGKMRVEICFTIIEGLYLCNNKF